jgi:hypothetical protein
LQFNVAIGGTQGYFAEGAGNKPWNNSSPGTAANEFWNRKDEWLPSWDLVGENSSLAIDYVKVFDMC